MHCPTTTAVVDEKETGEAKQRDREEEIAKVKR